MEDKKNILLISRDENCATEVMEFLLKSKCIFGIYKSISPNDAATAADYAYKGGPPTVIEGSGGNDLRVYCVLTTLNTIKSHMSHYDRLPFSRYNAVIMYLEGDNADNYNLILNYIKSRSYLKYEAEENEGGWNKSHNLTIIGNLSQCKLQSITKLLGCESSSWNWNGMFACNWSTHRCRINNLWIHINKYNYNTTRVFYISEIILRSITNMFVFFRQFVNVMYHNIYFTERRTEAVELCILTRYGDTYKQTKIAKDLLNQFNILTMSDFAMLLKEEITQLARHLSRLAILCGEVVKIENSVLLPHFRSKKEFILGYQEETNNFARIGEITTLAIYSLDAMSEMKYTGKYIKDVLGIEILNSLKSCLENFPNFRNTRTDSLSVPTTVKNDSLGNKGRGKQESQPENRTQDILVEDRIGNIQLLKSLQNTLQEFTDELKKVRELQEYNTEVVTKEIKIIKEKLKNNCSCNHLNQKLDEDRSRTKE